MPNTRRKFGAAALVVGATVLLRGTAHAQADLFSLEAAYIFNLAEFTDWPAAQAHGSSLTVCANPRSDLGIALSKLDGRHVAGKAWSARPLPESADIAACNVLVLDDSVPAAVTKEALASDLPLLIICAADSAAGPCVVRLVRDRDRDRLGFDIDNSEAARRHLGLSSKLLRLARKVL